MKKRKSIAIITAAFILCTILAGCGGPDNAPGSASRSASEDLYSSYDGGYSSANETAFMMGSPEAKAMYDMEDSLEFEGDYDTASPLASGAAKETSDNTGMSSESSQEPEKINIEKLVYTGSITVETTQFSSTLTRIKQTVSDMGGFIESEEDSDDAHGWYMEGYRKSSSSLRSYIQARIPSARFYEFLDGIEGEGAKVTNRSVNVQNISRQYSETATSIESYQIQERRLLDMMEDATRVSDMLEIESRLSEVQGYLKQYQNALSGMDTDVAYSTVSISLREVGIYSQPEATTFVEKIQESFSDGIQSFMNDLQNFCIWFVGNVFNLIIFILVIWILILIIKKIVRRPKKERKTRKERRSKGGKAVPEIPENDSNTNE